MRLRSGSTHLHRLHLRHCWALPDGTAVAAAAGTVVVAAAAGTAVVAAVAVDFALLLLQGLAVP